MDNTDNRGTEIRLEQIVAFNISGQVAEGTIIDIKEGTRYGHPAYIYEIELNHKAAGHTQGHKSKVRNSKNLLVIQTPSFL